MLHYSPYSNSFFDVLFKDVQNHKVLADIEAKFNVIASSFYLFIIIFFHRCCEVCGKVVYQDLFTEEPTFVKGAGGEVWHRFFVSVVMQI